MSIRNSDTKARVHKVCTYCEDFVDIEVLLEHSSMPTNMKTGTIQYSIIFMWMWYIKRSALTRDSSRERSKMPRVQEKFANYIVLHMQNYVQKERRGKNRTG